MNPTSERPAKSRGDSRLERGVPSEEMTPPSGADTGTENTDAAAESRQALADRIRRDHQRGTRKKGAGAKVLVTVLVVVACAALLWFQYLSSQRAADEIAVPRHATEDYGFLLTAASADGGDDAADAEQPEGLVPVVIYEDFLCPSCGLLHEQSGELLSSQVAGGLISLEYRPFAFLVNASPDEYSQRAANAAVCVADLAGVPAFVTMHGLLFEHQPAEGTAGPSDAELTAFAETAGAADAASCITERRFDAWVAESLQAAVAADVTSTPTIWVDGVSILKSTDGKQSMPGAEELQFAIEKAAG